MGPSCTLLRSRGELHVRTTATGCDVQQPVPLRLVHCQAPTELARRPLRTVPTQRPGAGGNHCDGTVRSMSSAPAGVTTYSSQWLHHARQCAPRPHVRRLHRFPTCSAPPLSGDRRPVPARFERVVSDGSNADHRSDLAMTCRRQVNTASTVARAVLGEQALPGSATGPPAAAPEGALRRCHFPALRARARACARARARAIRASLPSFQSRTPRTVAEAANRQAVISSHRPRKTSAGRPVVTV